MRTPGCHAFAASASSLGACAYERAYYGGLVGLGRVNAAYDRGACWNYGWNGWYGLPYCRWYDDFFYPGFGVYVYGRDHHRHGWDHNQQAYWYQRATHWRSQPRTNVNQHVTLVTPSVSTPRLAGPKVMPRPRAPRPVMRGGIRIPRLTLSHPVAAPAA